MRLSMALTAAGASSPGSSARLAASLPDGVGERLRQHLRHGFGQRQQPGRFDAHALADQAAFRQHRAQRVGTLAITAIDGRERREVLRNP